MFFNSRKTYQYAISALLLMISLMLSIVDYNTNSDNWNLIPIFIYIIVCITSFFGTLLLFYFYDKFKK
jgi:uncharacterized membrane protein